MFVTSPSKSFIITSLLFVYFVHITALHLLSIRFSFTLMVFVFAALVYYFNVRFILQRF